MLLHAMNIQTYAYVNIFVSVHHCDLAKTNQIAHKTYLEQTLQLTQHATRGNTRTGSMCLAKKQQIKIDIRM